MSTRPVKCYMVRFDVNDEEDFIVYRTSDLCKLFAEIIDLLGYNGRLLSVEKIVITDLDILEV